MFLIQNDEAVHAAIQSLQKSKPAFRLNSYKVDRTSITFFGGGRSILGKLQYRYQGNKLVFIQEEEISHELDKVHCR